MISVTKEGNSDIVRRNIYYSRELYIMRTKIQKGETVLEKAVVGALTAAILVTFVACATAIYLTVSINNTGTIVAHGCKVYLDDKTTESYTISWGQIKVNQTLTNYRWLYNNGTAGSVNLFWNHNAASYLSLRIYYELPNQTWQELPQNQQMTFSQGQWLHLKITLTTLPEAVNHQGSFGFNIFVELT
jgi:hypothetical protein